MYSPTTRLLTVLELLQSYHQLSGSEIARRLEVDVRTVRRYIVTLQDMGIPVEAERGPYGAYHLERGKRLPPMLFTNAEAVAITMGLMAIREFNFPVDVAAVEGALAKTERVLPENLLHQARSLQEAITFNVSHYRAGAPEFLKNDFLVTLSSAVLAHQRVFLSYRSWGGDDSEREFDPYGIVFNEGYWYTAGYCHLREGLRTFRLDRIVELEPVTDTFEKPDDFDTLDFVMNAIAFVPSAHQIEVLLKTTMEEARTTFPPIMGTLEEVEAGVIFRRAATQLDWIAHVLIMADFEVEVRQPDALREMFRQIAEKAARLGGEKTIPLKDQSTCG